MLDERQRNSRDLISRLLAVEETVIGQRPCSALYFGGHAGHEIEALAVPTHC